MKLTIFSRLVIGYLSIFLLLITVSIYTISKLNRFEKITRSIITVDNRLRDYEQKLSGTLLSLIRYERKYTIIKDKNLYDHFLLTKKDFEKQLRDITSIADSSRIRQLLKKINLEYGRYLAIFEKEADALKSGIQYPVDSYKHEKETAVNSIMESLKTIKYYNQEDTYEKFKSLSFSEFKAKKAVIIIGTISLVFAVIISTVTTLSITRPLSVMKHKTREISQGVFKDDLDISSPEEIKDLAESINLMCMKLKALDKLKTDFFSLMSHELRTPLTTIKEGTNLFLEGFESGKSEEKQKRLLQIIKDECERLITLVNSLLDLSKMEAGMLTYNFTNNNLLSLIDKAAREIEPLAETKNIKLGLNADTSAIMVKADGERIMQVLRNLIGNAVKFSPADSSVDISAQLVEDGVKLSVTDSGPGIPPEDLNNIFDKYHQAIHEGSDKIKGTGLGLSIVKHIVTAHGGKVWVESTSENGSTFTFVLPV